MTVVRSRQASRVAPKTGNRPTPKPYQRPTGPANDNIPKPANDNRPPRPPPGFTRRPMNPAQLGRMAFRGFAAGQLGDAFLGVLNNLPGYAQPLTVSEKDWGRIQNQGMANMPVYIVWDLAAPGGITAEAFSLRNSRQTGQAVAPNAMPTIAPGAFASSRLWYYTPLGLLRANEQVTYGPNPATQNTRIARYNWPIGTPTPTAFPKPVPWPLQPYKWQPLADTGLTVHPNKAPRPVPNFVPKRPPGPGVKERKTRAQKILLALVGILDAFTEAEDLLDAFHDALPDRFKSKLPKNKLKADEAKLRDLYAHWDKVDLDSALFNAAWNQVQDYVYGKMGLKVPGRFGGAQGANQLMSDAFGDAQHDLLKRANQQSKELFNRLTGLTII